ncbi:MAG: DUF1836 domain-containing protein [Eubacteriales bacterium]|nr:DUF1836 domain-containing protein [Eubacteriales bacterium]
MSTQAEEMRRELDRLFEAYHSIRTADIPGIDLYMDQVTTFLQENLSSLSRHPGEDKFLTKTMINNYVKNKVLMPPVKKKYSREHMMMLIMIYYMKSFLSIGDIREIISPLMERYASSPASGSERKRDSAERRRDHAEKKPALRLQEIYESIVREIDTTIPDVQSEIIHQIETTENAFAEVPEEDRPLLQRFALICRLSAEVYMRKLFIEKLLDSGELS